MTLHCVYLSPNNAVMSQCSFVLTVLRAIIIIYVTNILWLLCNDCNKARFHFYICGSWNNQRCCLVNKQHGVPFFFFFSGVSLIWSGEKLIWHHFDNVRQIFMYMAGLKADHHSRVRLLAKLLLIEITITYILYIPSLI